LHESFLRNGIFLSWIADRNILKIPPDPPLQPDMLFSYFSFLQRSCITGKPADFYGVYLKLNSTPYFVENNHGYFSEIVYLRAFAILAVISIHVSSCFTSMERATFLTFFYMSVDTISHFAVPLFVCISGFVLFNKYQGSYSLRRFYKKRFLSVIPQYLFFTAIALLFSYCGSLFLQAPWKRSLSDIMYQIFMGTAFFHLWFFVLIIQLYALYPVIERIFEKFNEKGRLMLLFIILYGIRITLPILSMKEGTLLWTSTLFLGYLFYFVLGMYVRSLPAQYAPLSKASEYFPLLFFVVMVSTLLGTAEYYMTNFSTGFGVPVTLISAMVNPFYYVCIFVLCVYSALKISEVNHNIWVKLLLFTGNFSFGIYLVHAFILMILLSIIYPRIGFDVTHFLFFPVTFFLVLVFSLCTVAVLKRVPCHEFMIGK
jgi:probable poly-beta-1,6-N-acetyl-D-glucosamine export protein